MKKDVFTFIKEHTYINYCECIIDKDGLIEYANPNHIKVLIKYTGKTEDEIYNEMDIFDSPIHWLIQRTGCIAVYTNGYLLPDKVTDKQRFSLEALITNKLTSEYGF